MRGDSEVADRASELDYRSAAGVAAQAVSGGRPRRHQDSDSNMRSRTAGSCSKPEPAGSANLLLLDLPPDVAAAARERIDYLGPQTPQLMTGGPWISVAPMSPSTCSPGTASHWVGGMVDLTVDLRTLLGLAEDPGELGGWGPVVADIARQVTDRQTRRAVAGHRHRRQRRPPGGGGQTSPHHLAGPSGEGPEPHLRVPRMPPTRPILRPRPHPTPHRRRTHAGMEPGTAVRIPPPGQRRRRLAIPAPTKRRPRLDQPPRPYLRHRGRSP